MTLRENPVNEGLFCPECRKLQLNYSIQLKLNNFIEDELTLAEYQVVELVVTSDWTYKRIGLELGRSWRTIDSQLQSIYRKCEKYFELNSITRSTLVQILSPYW